MISRAELKKRRIKLGISQEKLAEEAGLSYRTIIRFEKGQKVREATEQRIEKALKRLEEMGNKPDFWWLTHKKDLEY